MDPIKEALTFDDVTMAPKYSEVLPSEVDTSTKLSSNLTLKIPLLSSAMDTVTESKMAIAIAKAGGIGVIHRNLDIKKQVEEIKKVKKLNLLVGAAVGAGPLELKRAEAILKEKVDLIVVDTAHGHSKKVAEIIKAIKKLKTNKTTLCAGNIAGAALGFAVELGHDTIFHDHRLARRATVKPEHFHVEIHANGRGERAGRICPHAQTRSRGPGGLAPLAHDMHVID